MSTMELVVDNYIQALLKAVLIIANTHHAYPLYEIEIAGYMQRGNLRKLYPRCRVTTYVNQKSYPRSTVIQDYPGEEFLIVYPIRNSIFL